MTAKMPLSTLFLIILSTTRFSAGTETRKGFTVLCLLPSHFLVLFHSIINEVSASLLSLYERECVCVRVGPS